MWEILLTTCLALDSGQCATERREGGATYEECRARAEKLIPPPGWDAQAWPCVEVGASPAMPVTEIAPGVFVRRGAHAEIGPENGGAVANAGFVIGERAVAVIDAGGALADGAALRAAIRARTDLPIRWVALTHMHPDHVLGAAAFVEEGATVIGHANLPRALAARAESYRAAADRALGGQFGAATVVLPDETVAATRDIDLGGRILRLEAHPAAHTDNDMSVRDLATDTWFVGDLVFKGHFPSLDGALNGWIATLDAMAARPAARIVPGHGPVAAPWPESAAPLRAYLEDLRAAARASVARGEPMLSAVRAIAAQAPPGWTLAEAFAERNATAAIREMEWE
ncbi:MAG: quinoprotein relay system zinc metallohydrolase 2 [Rubrimonas sp.]|uniref:quinoprotein relay system zinc metallohydrolase 2 n=1 Tax=Rubrimonas sp. TaxID=2036015 RepID=UPI002FDE340B